MNVNDTRMADYLDTLDTAADYYPTWHALPGRAKMPRLDLTAHNCWREAWRRGLISDIDMAWYTMLINRHPTSWMGWLKGM